MKNLKESNIQTINSVDQISNPNQEYKIDWATGYDALKIVYDEFDKEYYVMGKDKGKSRFDYINLGNSGMNANLKTFKTMNGAKKALTNWLFKIYNR